MGQPLWRDRAILKLTMRGGLIRLTSSELLIGMGFFGTRDLRRIHLGEIVAMELEEGIVATAGARLRVRRAADEIVLDGVSPLAARRLQQMVRALQGRSAQSPVRPTAPAADTPNEE